MKHSEPHWYAVHTIARQESITAARLWHRFPVFVPRRQVTIRHARRTTVELRPALPRFVMVRCRNTDVGIVNRTQGVSTVLSMAGEPMPIPDPVFEAFRSGFDRDGIELEEPEDSPFKPGDTVKLDDRAGPFAGHTAEIERVDGPDGLRVLLQAFGRFVPTRVMAEWAELVA